jgi:ring-1,2-phenylacetyl-CoA epoxidase subunit PaaA
MAWGIKRHSNDELRQRYVDMTVPQAEVLGVTLPDPELALDPETGHHRFGPIDWDEFKRVISGNGPANAERIRRRRAARDGNAWVTEAATAYAAKRTGERASRGAPATEERNAPGADPASTAQKHAAVSA